MKIVEHNTHRLTLRLRPWMNWIFSGVFIGFGLLPIAVTSHQELTCDRTPTPGRCELRSKRLFRPSQLNTFQVTTLQRAIVESSRDGDGDRIYRVTLLTEQGSMPLTSVYSAGRSRHQRNADVINAFLQNSEQLSLRVNHDDRWSILLVLLLSCGTGLLLLVFTGQVITCDLDRWSDTLLITRRGLLGNQSIKQPLGDVANVVVQNSSGSDGGRTYRICFLLANGKEVPVTFYYSAGRNNKWKTVELIRQFLASSEPRY